MGRKGDRRKETPSWEEEGPPQQPIRSLVSQMSHIAKGEGEGEKGKKNKAPGHWESRGDWGLDSREEIGRRLA